MIKVLNKFWMNQCTSNVLFTIGLTFIIYHLCKFIYSKVKNHLQTRPLNEILEKTQSNWVVIFNMDKNHAEMLMVYRKVCEKKLNTIFVLKQKDAQLDNLMRKILTIEDLNKTKHLIISYEEGTPYENVLIKLETEIKEKNINILIMMQGELIDNMREDKFMSNQMLSHYETKIQLYSLCPVALLKGNKNSDLIIVSQKVWFQIKSLDYALQDSFKFLEKCISNEVSRIKFFTMKDI